MAESEYWLRGPVENIPSLLQPAAHALFQSKLEAHKYTANLKDDMLWKTPFERASIAFHLQHMTGVIDRMLTYAKSQDLSEAQFEYLNSEGKENPDIALSDLLMNLDHKIEDALQYFKF